MSRCVNIAALLRWLWYWYYFWYYLWYPS